MVIKAANQIDESYFVTHFESSHHVLSLHTYFTFSLTHCSICSPPDDNRAEVCWVAVWSGIFMRINMKMVEIIIENFIVKTWANVKCLQYIVQSKYETDEIKTTSSITRPLLTSAFLTWRRTKLSVRKKFDRMAAKLNEWNYASAMTKTPKTRKMIFLMQY